uniref:Uncharacterized protein n=1 Tax=Onchocerca volvulus TaxID=6282 RepID=A0A8R1U3Y4_ONCVO
MPLIAMEESGAEVVEPPVTVELFCNRIRTINITIPLIQLAPGVAVMEVCQPADVGCLPRQFRRKLISSQVDAYTVVFTKGNPTNEFSLSEINKLVVYAPFFFFHNLLLPSSLTNKQKRAAVELHVLDCFPRTRAVVMNERQVKRRKLDLVGRKEEAQSLFVQVQMQKMQTDISKIVK